MAGKGNQQPGSMTVDQQGSPAPKRKVPDPENLALSIDVIREAIRGELKDAMTDLKQEMWGMSKRVDQVEGQVTKQIQQTINMLDEMTAKHVAQGEMLQQLQEANREVTFRLECLEKRGGAASSTAGSTVARGRHSETHTPGRLYLLESPSSVSNFWSRRKTSAPFLETCLARFGGQKGDSNL